MAQITKLDKPEQWSIRKFQIIIAFKSTSTWKVVTGVHKAPEPLAETADAAAKATYATALDKFENLDAIAQRIMTTTITEKSMLHIVNCSNAKTMWEKLQAVFEGKTEASIYSLQQEWFTVCMKP